MSYIEEMPTPKSHSEKYLAAMADDTYDIPTPKVRKDKFMAAVAEKMQNSDPPAPMNSRIVVYITGNAQEGYEANYSVNDIANAFEHNADTTDIIVRFTADTEGPRRTYNAALKYVEYGNSDDYGDYTYVYFDADYIDYQGTYQQVQITGTYASSYDSDTWNVYTSSYSFAT